MPETSAPKTDVIRLALVNRYFTHYRAPLIDIVAQYPDIELTQFCHVLSKPMFDMGVPIAVNDRDYLRPAQVVRGPGFLSKLELQWGSVLPAISSRYDVVVCEGQISFATNILIILMRRLLGRPVVLWAKGYFRNPQEMDGALGMLRRLWLTSCHQNLCYGDATRDQCLKIGKPREELTVLHNTVDIDGLLDRPLGVNEREPDAGAASPLVILHFGRLSKAKRVDLLISAFARIADKHPLARLDIAGDGPQGDSLRQLADEAGVRDRVNFLGFVDEAIATDLYAQAHIFASSGAVGLSLNEAMAAGCAIAVADELGPDSEPVTDEVTGLRVPTPSVELWAAALDRLAGDAALRRRLGSAARGRMREVGRITSMAENFATGVRTVYQRMGAGRRRRPVAQPH